MISLARRGLLTRAADLCDGIVLRATESGVASESRGEEKLGEEKSKEGRAAHLCRGGGAPLLEKTIGQLLGEAALKWGNRECIVSIHQDVRISFSELLRRADRFAAGLKKLGLKKGDRIGIWGPNDLEWFVTAMASARAGLVTVTINPAYQHNEVLYAIRKVGVRAIVSPDGFKTQKYPRMLLEVKKSYPSLEHIIIYSDEHTTGTRRFADIESLASKIEIERVAAEQSEISPYDGCNVQFTSGTTGKPKATLISHRSLVNNSRQTIERSELSPERRVCLNVPFFHAFGLVMGQMSTLHAGSVVVLESRSFNPVKSLEGMLREKCDVTYGTPTMWINLMDASHRTNIPTVKLFSGTTGGSPASAELFRRIKNCFHFENMKTIYGMTECTGITFQSMAGEDPRLVETTIGHLSDHTEALVVDDAGSAVPFGTPGELWIRGYSTMMRYWDDEAATRKTLTEDGWLKTGDRFVLRPDGYGHIIGRFKDVVIRGGENIYPKEVEDFLMTHPLIAEAQVIGAYDPVYGEEICACVRLQHGAQLTGDQLRDYCKGKISYFKIPRYVEFVKEYPKTASGKIMKYRLKEEMERAGVIPPSPK